MLTQCSCSKLLRASVVAMKQPIIASLRNQNLSPAKLRYRREKKRENLTSISFTTLSCYRLNLSYSVGMLRHNDF